MSLTQILHDLADGKRGAELHAAIDAIAPVLETLIPGGPIIGEVAQGLEAAAGAVTQGTAEPPVPPAPPAAL